MKDMIILAIESSCDETAAAVVKNGREVLSNIISTQIPLHQKYGGVVPEIASRKHVESILPVIDNALKDAGVTIEDIDAVGVTYGPGLVGALLVGLTAAKSLAFAANKPLIPVNHIEGHIAANYIEHKELEPPFVCLVASGGHSHIVNIESYSKLEILGQTRDDAAGEAFDKIARALGLGYPGGPAIDKTAKNGNPNAVSFPKVKFENGSLDFSFSGVKTAVLNYLNQAAQRNEQVIVEDVCASFQKAVVDVLVDNTLEAAAIKGVESVALAGGVAANSRLREELLSKGQAKGLKVYYPSLILCTDNAAMIGCGAYYEYLAGARAGLDLNAVPGLKIGKR